MDNNRNALPFRPISSHYKEIFQKKIYKIPVSTADSCPNRDGLKGMQTCIFCDVHGSAAQSDAHLMTLDQQIEKYSVAIQKKYKANEFLIYFQAYTNTFLKFSTIKEQFEQCLKYPFVKGFVVGTRPDCLSPALLNFWQEMGEKYYVSIELGVQSFNDKHLEFIKRGHTVQQSLQAIEKIGQLNSVHLGIHLMFGMPGETDQEIIDTALLINTLPVSNVKLHNLHVLKETPLETLFANGEFLPIEKEDYARRMQLFLEHLNPRIFVQRLAAFAPRWEELVAPRWTSDKMGTHQYLIDFLRAEKSYQGKQFISRTDQERTLQKEFFENSIPLSLA